MLELAKNVFGLLGTCVLVAVFSPTLRQLSLRANKLHTNVVAKALINLLVLVVILIWVVATCFVVLEFARDILKQMGLFENKTFSMIGLIFALMLWALPTVVIRMRSES